MPSSSPPSTATDWLAFGPFVLDGPGGRLLRDGAPVDLPPRPYALLAWLAARPGRLVAKDELLDAVWGHRHVSDSALKVAMNTLRAALGEDAKAPRWIETVARRGYRFASEVRPLGAASAAASAAVPAAPAATACGNLPPPLPGLVGRELEAAQLAALLACHRLVTLVGLGGVGKTRLALAVAASERAPDGVWLLRLDALADGEPLAATIAQVLHLGAAAGADAAALGRALAPLQLLLVLDNAEHLVEPVAALAAALLAAAPALRLLVTSQLPLRVAGEQVLPLAPLALPDALAAAAPLPDYAAARLFCERVRQQLPQYAPAAAEHADIAAICRALDGVPLALELAAARVPLLGTAGVRARLDQRFALLTRGARDSAARHRTLAAALDWTCGLLPTEDRRALHRLAVFAGSFAPEAAEAVLADDAAPLDRVDALHERSLLVVEAGEGVVEGGAAGNVGPRLRLFDSVRCYVLERGAERGAVADDVRSAQQLHLVWMRRRFEQADAQESDTPLLSWLPPLRQEVDNLRAALRHGLGAAAGPAAWACAQRLAAASAGFWYRSGHGSEGLRWMRAAQALPPADAGIAARLDLALAQLILHTQAGAPAEAMAALRRALPVLQAAGDLWRSYLALYHEHMGLVRLGAAGLPDPAGDVQAARDALRAGMHALVAPHWGAIARRYLQQLEVLALRERGELAQAVAACAEGVRALRAAGAQAESWPLVNLLGQLLGMQGRFADADAVLAEAVAEVRAGGMLREQVPLVAIAASVALRRGGGAAAQRLAQEALLLLRAEGRLWWMADALPWAAWHAGRVADAARLQAWADARAGARGELRGPFFAALRAAMVQALGGEPPAGLAGAVAGLDEAGVQVLAFGPC